MANKGNDDDLRVDSKVSLGPPSVFVAGVLGRLSGRGWLAEVRAGNGDGDDERAKTEVRITGRVDGNKEAKVE